MCLETNGKSQHDTAGQFREIIKACRELYVKKLHDYSTAWRILRIPSVTDQLLNKAKRIRSIEEKGVSLVSDSIESEFIGLVNYSIIGLIQLELHPVMEEDIDARAATELYDKYSHEAFNLMERKNHDYDEAWRGMRISSFTDLILMKLYRTKQIEDLKGNTLESEGIDANYFDIINYSVFALIKIKYGD